MTKAELVSKMAEEADMPKSAAEAALNAFIKVVKGTLAEGDQVTLIGFGSFKVVEKKERTGRNPKTGKEVQIPACKAPKFTPGKDLKEAVNCPAKKCKKK